MAPSWTGVPGIAASLLVLASGPVLPLSGATATSQQKNKNEDFDNLPIVLLIDVYALAKIRQVEYKKPVEKYAWYDTGSHHASRRQRGQQCN